MSTENQKKSGTPQIVILDKALKLAEQWVSNMSSSVEDEKIENPEGRRDRLGLGAKVPRVSKVGSFNDPVVRKLHAKLEAGKKRAARSEEEPLPVKGEGHNSNDDDDSDEELESRTNAFTKKRAGPPTPSLQVKKKPK